MILGKLKNKNTAGAGAGVVPTPLIGKTYVPPGAKVIPANPYAYKPPGKYDEGLADLFFGARGEVKIEELESDKDFCLGMFNDGVWESRRNDIGLFSYLKHPFQVPYLTKPGYHVFEFALPKIPYGIVLGIADFYKKIMATHSGAEAMVQVWWDKTKEEYFTYVPIQKVGAASVQFDHSEELQNDIDKIWVMDSHSHNTMSAFFSGGDNADEKSTRVFAVLGRLNLPEWESKWRAGCNGQYVNLEKDDICDMDNAEVVEISDLETLKVSKLVYGRYDYNNNVNRINNVRGGRKVAPGYPAHNYPINGWDDNVVESDFGYAPQGMALGNDAGIFGAVNEIDYRDFELESIILEFEKINEQSVAGDVDVALFALLARRVVEYIVDHDEFEPLIGTAIIDEMSTKMKKQDFSRIMEAYYSEQS